MNPSIHRAQTNIQLYRQLVGEGYSPSDLACVRDTYDLATGYFSGQFRGCGKTFIAHLVGVASVQTSVGSPVTQIQAGLLHSVYTFGDFGGVSPGFTEKKRKALRAMVGREVEELVHAFHNLKWDEEDIDRLLQQEQLHCSDAEHSAILIRLAHEIEEHADWSFLFDDKFDKAEVLRRISMITTLAERMHQKQLADYARRLAEDVQQAGPAMEPGSFRSGRVYTIVPNSCRLRYTPRRVLSTFRRSFLRKR